MDINIPKRFKSAVTRLKYRLRRKRTFVPDNFDGHMSLTYGEKATQNSSGVIEKACNPTDLIFQG